MTRPPHIDPARWHRAPWHARQAAIDAHNRANRQPAPEPSAQERAEVARAMEAAETKRQQRMFLGQAPQPGRCCSETGCDRPHEARGLCRKHYKALTRAVEKAGAAMVPLKSTYTGERVVWGDDDLWSPQELRGAHAAYVSGDRTLWAREGNRIWDRERQRARARRRRIAREDAA